MPQREQTYTYRGGQKIALEKSADQFVVRALPEKLKKVGIADAEKVSSASSRVTTRSSDLERMMSLSRAVAPTHHAYYVADTEEEFLVTDRILVTFRTAPTNAQVDAFAAKYSLILLNKVGTRDYLFQLTDHTGMNPVKLVVKLSEEEPDIESAEHDLNHRMTIYQLAVPTDPFYAREWHLHPVTDSEVDVRSCSQVEAAWRLLDHFGAADVVVGITDDGCKLDHGDFDSATKFASWGYLRGTRLVTKNDIDANPSEMYQAGSNHGTSCAGVIGAEVDATLTVGAAPGCRLLPIQWESDGPSLFISDSKLLTVLDFVEDKVDVLSNSWGGVPTSLWAAQVTNRISQLALTGGRRGKGILFLWAAGNENCPIQHTAPVGVNVPYDRGWRFNADNTRTWIGVSTTRTFRNNLVGIPGVMHIAALSSQAQRSHYSNYGTGILLSAPTNNVHEYLRATVEGKGITTTTGPGIGVTESFGGTSSATPLVAGIAALVISANADLTAQEVASILKQTASKDLSMDGYPRTLAAPFDMNPTWDISPIAPFNLGDFQNIGDADGTWSPWFGHGRIDAAAAVAEARRLQTTPTLQTLTRSSTPEMNIPDNNPTGARDTINFTEAATLASIRVKVNISHTFIGDLKITLIAPSGTAVVLRNRNGGNTQNLQTTFDFNTTPGLAALSGQSIQGNWTLFVQDLAARDAGRLNMWELEIQAGGVSTISLEEAAGTAIPDNDASGVERSLSTTETGTVKDVSVSVDITHTWIGDLLVKLVSPAGTEVVLHNRSGGSADNIIRSYSAAAVPALSTLQGQPLAGTWKLKVADLEAQDVGKLNKWSLQITR